MTSPSAVAEGDVWKPLRLSDRCRDCACGANGVRDVRGERVALVVRAGGDGPCGGDVSWRRPASPPSAASVPTEWQSKSSSTCFLPLTHCGCTSLFSTIRAIAAVESGLPSGCGWCHFGGLHEDGRAASPIPHKTFTLWSIGSLDFRIREDCCVRNPEVDRIRRAFH